VEEDELLEPKAVLAYALLKQPNSSLPQVAAIPKAKHLSVLLYAADIIGAWISKLAQMKNVSPA
jgi:hypothetical protein